MVGTNAPSWACLPLGKFINMPLGIKYAYYPGHSSACRVPHRHRFALSRRSYQTNLADTNHMPSPPGGYESINLETHFGYSDITTDVTITLTDGSRLHALQNRPAILATVDQHARTSEIH